MSECGLSPAAGARRRVHKRYKIEEGWKYPFRLSKTLYSEWGGHPKSFFCRLKSTDYSTKCAPLYTSSTTSHVSRGAIQVAGVSRGQGTS
jgi:hypothetical protein